MRYLEGQSRNIVKNAKRLLPIPVAMAAIAIASGCSNVYDVQFTDCSLDPQTKTVDRKLRDPNIPNTHVSNTALLLDGVRFTASRRNSTEIDLWPYTSDKVTVIKQNEVYSFKGLKNGRTYVVIFDRDFNLGLKNVTIVGTCDTAPQTKP